MGSTNLSQWELSYPPSCVIPYSSSFRISSAASGMLFSRNSFVKNKYILSLPASAFPAVACAPSIPERKEAVSLQYSLVSISSIKPAAMSIRYPSFKERFRRSHTLALRSLPGFLPFCHRGAICCETASARRFFASIIRASASLQSIPVRFICAGRSSVSISSKKSIAHISISTSAASTQFHCVPKVPSSCRSLTFALRLKAP